MIPVLRTRAAGPRLAWLALGTGVITAAVVLVRALTLQAPSAAAADALMVPEIGLRQNGAKPSLQLAFEDDPFAPSRRPPATPYRLVRPAAARPAPKKPSSKSRLPNMLGTVVATNGKSFATYDAGRRQLKHVRIGDTVDVYVVDSILQSRVVLRDSSGRQISVPTARD